MSVTAHPPGGMTGLEVGDVVYLTVDAYMDADLMRYGDDFPPVTVTQVGNVEDLHGTTVPGQGAPPSEWDWVAGATGPGFVGEYETSPGLGTEDLVFPMSAIDWGYTERGPKEPWAVPADLDPEGQGVHAGGSDFTEGRERITRRQIRRMIFEERDKMLNEIGYGFSYGRQEGDGVPYKVGDIIEYRTNTGRIRHVKVAARIVTDPEEQDLEQGIEYDEYGIKGEHDRDALPIPFRQSWVSLSGPVGR